VMLFDRRDAWAKTIKWADIVIMQMKIKVDIVEP
jgi:hypothetical protein